jgi:hypothetical protein
MPRRKLDALEIPSPSRWIGDERPPTPYVWDTRKFTSPSGMRYTIYRAIRHVSRSDAKALLERDREAHRQEIIREQNAEIDRRPVVPPAPNKSDSPRKKVRFILPSDSHSQGRKTYISGEGRGWCERCGQRLR